MISVPEERFASAPLKVAGGTTDLPLALDPAGKRIFRQRLNIVGYRLYRSQGTHRVRQLKRVLAAACLSFAIALVCVGGAVAADAPVPLLKAGQPVDWWFVFKFNTASFPGCGGTAERQCLFGGDVQDYHGFGQQYVYASKGHEALQKGSDCAGDTIADPIGATYDQVFNGSSFYVVWNDQFYDDPEIAGCRKECGSPWGHSKGLLAWDGAGNGFVMQVTTPNWPGAGSQRHPRHSNGNTLGCIAQHGQPENNVLVSQHFFALKITKSDLLKVLHALSNASVVTDPKNPQIVNNGGPADVRAAVEKLGTKSAAKDYTRDVLSSGVVLISKPSRLAVPPWQLVSSVLGSMTDAQIGISLRTATWWAKPWIYTTTPESDITCWSDHLLRPGAVEIAKTGQWGGKKFGLTGGPGANFNHAKFGVSISGSEHYAIFGDMNQQGAASGDRCAVSQNGRGGIFYVIKDQTLSEGLKDLLTGETASSGSQ